MTAFIATKLLSLLIYPLSLSLMLCLLALLLRWLGWARRAFYTLLLGLGWLYICSTSLFANYLMGGLERDFVSRAMSVVPQVDAIVLLGGAMRGDTHMGTLPDLNQQADRLLYAVALYKAGKAPVILVTGGSVVGNRPEARQMKEVLTIMGVPAQDIVLESESVNTHDNAVFSARLLQAKKLQRVLLVTSAFHMRRALGAFLAQGVDAVPAPTDFQRIAGRSLFMPGLPAVSNLARTTYALHEIIGYQVYRWRRWL